MQTASVLELEAWVAGNELRIGAHKDGEAKGAPGALTPIGKELADGEWSAVFWGRGTMLNLAGIEPAAVDLPPEASAAVHAMALVNELGVGLKVAKDGLTLRGMMRTTWANPPELAAKLIAISGDDIVHGRATEPAKAAAAANAGTPFATDFASGQGGLMVPAAALGIVSAVVLPAIDRILGRAAAASDEPLDAP
jgi:hypothetical protein